MAHGIIQFYLPPTHAFTPQLQGITALWLVLIAPNHEVPNATGGLGGFI